MEQNANMLELQDKMSILRNDFQTVHLPQENYMLLKQQLLNQDTGNIDCDYLDGGFRMKEIDEFDADTQCYNQEWLEKLESVENWGSFDVDAFVHQDCRDDDVSLIHRNRLVEMIPDHNKLFAESVSPLNITRPIDTRTYIRRKKTNVPRVNSPAILEFMGNNCFVKSSDTFLIDDISLCHFNDTDCEISGEFSDFSEPIKSHQVTYEMIETKHGDTAAVPSSFENFPNKTTSPAVKSTLEQSYTIASLSPFENLRNETASAAVKPPLDQSYTVASLSPFENLRNKTVSPAVRQSLDQSYTIASSSPFENLKNKAPAVKQPLDQSYTISYNNQLTDRKQNETICISPLNEMTLHNNQNSVGRLSSAIPHTKLDNQCCTTYDILNTAEKTLEVNTTYEVLEVMDNKNEVGDEDQMSTASDSSYSSANKLLNVEDVASIAKIQEESLNHMSTPKRIEDAIAIKFSSDEEISPILHLSHPELNGYQSDHSDRPSTPKSSRSSVHSSSTPSPLGSTLVLANNKGSVSNIPGIFASKLSLPQPKTLSKAQPQENKTVSRLTAVQPKPLQTQGLKPPSKLRQPSVQPKPSNTGIPRFSSISNIPRPPSRIPAPRTRLTRPPVISQNKDGKRGGYC